MKPEPAASPISAQVAASGPRKPWQTPAIEDADIGALTSGGGDSGMEGTPFLKTGS